MTRRSKPVGLDDREIAMPARWSVAPARTALVCVFAFVAAASFAPDARLWGVNHLAFYPTWVRIAALGLVGLSFVPRVARRLYAALLETSRLVKEGGRGVETGLAVVAVLSIVIFAGLRSATSLLGDGQLITNNFRLAFEGDPNVVTRSARAILTEEPVARGATLLYYAAAKFSNGVLQRPPVYGIQYFNCLLGAAFLFLLFGYLRERDFSSETRLWIIVLTLFATPMELFFGYVENYTPLVFMLFLYVAGGVSVLCGRGKLWVPAVLLVLCIFTHIQAVLLLPSLVFLAVPRGTTGQPRPTDRYAAPALILLTLVGVIAAPAYTGFDRFLLPLRGDASSYGTFSAAHVLDLVNEVLMLSPLLPVLVAMAWVTRGRASGEGRALGQFASVILGSCLAYLVFFRSGIGMARDWDLFSMAIVGLVPLSVVIIERFTTLAGDRDRVATIASPMILLTVVLGVSWIGINASSARTTDRFERILRYDRTHASYAYENLATFYRLQGDLPKAIGSLEKAIESSSNPRLYVFLAMLHDESGDPDAALSLCVEVLGSHPGHLDARLLAASILERQGRIAELADVARVGASQHRGEAMFWCYLGEAWIRLGKVEEGAEALRECKRLNPPPDRAARVDALLREAMMRSPDP